MTQLKRRAPAFLKFLKSRAFAASALTLLAAITVLNIWVAINTVVIHDGESVQTCYTMDKDPAVILEKNGIAVSSDDDVQFTGFEGKIGEINITRAFPVKITCDGETKTCMVTGGTVSEALELAGITLGKYDRISIPGSHKLKQGDEIAITRRSIVTRSEKVEIPYESHVTPTPLLGPGEQQVVEEGEPGLLVNTYSQTLIDGKAQQEKLLSTNTVKEPQDEEILKGFASQSVSGFDFEFPFDENGEPVGYTSVLRGLRAAGYSAPAGAGTASGRAAMVGHVAVNPNVIPYGTKLFIQSPGGGFVYGYAIAADTGTALTQGIVDLDLFYATYAESAQNGIKYVDVYILP